MAAPFQFDHAVAFSPENAEAVLRSIPTLPGVFALRGARDTDEPYLTRAADCAAWHHPGTNGGCVVMAAQSVVAVAVLLVKLGTISKLAEVAAHSPVSAPELLADRLELVVHSSGGLLVLIIPVVLSVYKPRGRTPFDRSATATRFMKPN